MAITASTRRSDNSHSSFFAQLPKVCFSGFIEINPIVTFFIKSIKEILDFKIEKLKIMAPILYAKEDLEVTQSVTRGLKNLESIQKKIDEIFQKCPLENTFLESEARFNDFLKKRIAILEERVQLKNMPETPFSKIPPAISEITKGELIMKNIIKHTLHVLKESERSAKEDSIKIEITKIQKVLKIICTSLNRTSQRYKKEKNIVLLEYYKTWRGIQEQAGIYHLSLNPLSDDTDDSSEEENDISTILDDLGKNASSKNSFRERKLPCKKRTRQSDSCLPRYTSDFLPPSSQDKPRLTIKDLLSSQPSKKTKPLSEESSTSQSVLPTMKTSKMGSSTLSSADSRSAKTTMAIIPDLPPFKLGGFEGNTPLPNFFLSPIYD